MAPGSAEGGRIGYEGGELVEDESMVEATPAGDMEENIRKKLLRRAKSRTTRSYRFQNLISYPLNNYETTINGRLSSGYGTRAL